MTDLMPLKAPFPWFGGKSLAASLVHRALGDIGNYIEPFAGSLGALLAFPSMPRVVTLNDLDGYVVNFWRSVQSSPDDVARWADWPVSELDLTARHAWLVTQGAERISQLQSDPDFFDAKVAGWWVWGICSWIGSGFCSGNGPWRLVDGALTKTKGDAGPGINRQLPHLGWVQGINRQLPHLGDAGRGITDVMRMLSERLRGARITCGQWTRVLGPSVRRHSGICGIFLDPPYLTSHDVYRTEHAQNISHDVRAWALEHAEEPRTRIVLAAYEGDFDMPGWGMLRWTTKGACYSSAKGNNRREVLWLSPQCNQPGKEMI